MPVTPNAKQTVMIGCSIVAIAIVSKAMFPETETVRRGHAAVRSASVSGWSNAHIDDGIRFQPTTRPYRPVAQTPPVATTENTDTGKPPQQWQRMTDDWFGLRPKLDDKGIAINGSIAGYAGKNFTGGRTTSHGGGAYLLNLNVSLDSQKLVGYEGGTFFLNFRTQNGLHNSLDGSFGSTSHLYTAARTEISEGWYQQQLLDSKVQVKLGKIDANTDFGSVANGGQFLNNFGGFTPTILGFPTDPDPAFGIDAAVHPTSFLYLSAGVFDGSALQGAKPGLLGPSKIFHERTPFFIAELGSTWTLPNHRDGRVGFGVWHHAGDFDRFNGGVESGATGPYATLDQTLWRANPDVDGDDQGIAMFLIGGYANPSVSAVEYQIGGGAKWTGAIPYRSEDVTGIGASYIRFSDAAGAGFDKRAETTVEMFYKIRLNAWLSVQPDLQYVHDPGGINSQRDAVAGTVQVIADF